MLAPTVKQGDSSAGEDRNGSTNVPQTVPEEVDNCLTSSTNDEEEATPEQSQDAGDIKPDGDDDDDDVTVIVLHQNTDGANGQQFAIAWSGQTGPQVEERRRSIMLQELQRVQRTSFLHFLILCLIPTILLFIVIGTVMSEDEDCLSDATICHKEARNFINAFTTRCVCEAIAVPRSI